MKTHLAGALGALGLSLVAGSATAQAYTATLQDGRTVTVARSSVPCGEPHNTEEAAFALALAFGCDDTISGMTGEGALLISREAGRKTPREYLIESALQYAPQASEDERAALLVEMRVTLESGVFNMLCLPVENDDRTAGEVTCVLDQPGTQFVVAGRSYDLDQAMGAVAMFMSTVAIR